MASVGQTGAVGFQTSQQRVEMLNVGSDAEGQFADRPFLRALGLVLMALCFMDMRHQLKQELPEESCVS